MAVKVSGFAMNGARALNLSENGHWPMDTVKDLDLSRKDINSDFTPDNCCFTKTIVTIEKRSTSKLNRQKAQEIRRLYNEGALSQDQLAQKYGVTPSTISRIICNKAWKAS